MSKACPPQKWERADKYQHDRQKAVDRLIAKISKSQKPKSLLNNYVYTKFLMIKGKTKLRINQDKIVAEAAWDGDESTVKARKNTAGN